jgi:hypothetical protein
MEARSGSGENLKIWVDDMRRMEKIDDGDKYLTRLNFDLYFLQVIVLKENIEPNVDSHKDVKER